jgi:hypothetical protein
MLAVFANYIIPESSHVILRIFSQIFLTVSLKTISLKSNCLALFYTKIEITHTMAFQKRILKDLKGFTKEPITNCFVRVSEEDVTW